MAHLGAFAPCTSLIGGLIKFFMIIISVIGYGFVFPLTPLPHQKFSKWRDEN
jgi:hypothetical protein